MGSKGLVGCSKVEEIEFQVQNTRLVVEKGKMCLVDSEEQSL